MMFSCRSSLLAKFRLVLFQSVRPTASPIHSVQRLTLMLCMFLLASFKFFRVHFDLFLKNLINDGCILTLFSQDTFAFGFSIVKSCMPTRSETAWQHIKRCTVSSWGSWKYRLFYIVKLTFVCLSKLISFMVVLISVYTMVAWFCGNCLSVMRTFYCTADDRI